MPEGDTVQKLAGALGPSLIGQALRRTEIWGVPAPRLVGARVTRVFAWGKHLFIETDAGLLVRTHLGMYGSWHRYGIGEPWRRPARQASLVLETGEEVLVCFNAREVECLPVAGLRHRDLAARLGPSLLDPGLSPTDLPERARRALPPETLLVDLLLHQGVASGIGNVYKSEVLFLEGRAPQTALGAIADAAVAALYGRAQELMACNLGGGPRVTRRAQDGAGGLWVYGRRGRPCLRCGVPVLYARLGLTERSTYWCPRCQPGPGS